VVIGIIGIALTGQTFVIAVKQYGLRRAPAIVWHTLVRGQVDSD
jgi:hypothetical protein